MSERFIGALGTLSVEPYFGFLSEEEGVEGGRIILLAQFWFEFSCARPLEVLVIHSILVGGR